MKNTYLIFASFALLFVGCNQSKNEPSAPNQSNNQTSAEKVVEVEAESFKADQASSKVNKAKINCWESLTVQETARPLWTGVESCCDADRYKKEVESDFNKWIETEKSKHPDYTLDSSTRGKYSPNCNDLGGGIDGRSCTGSTTVRYTARFSRMIPENPIQYNRPYTAIRRTEWISHPADASAETGYIDKGEQVNFSENLGRDEWQIAQLRNGTVVYVHPNDFE